MTDKIELDQIELDEEPIELDEMIALDEPEEQEVPRGIIGTGGEIAKRVGQQWSLGLQDIQKSIEATQREGGSRASTVVAQNNDWPLYSPEQRRAIKDKESTYIAKGMSQEDAAEQTKELRIQTVRKIYGYMAERSAEAAETHAVPPADQKPLKGAAGVIEKLVTAPARFGPSMVISAASGPAGFVTTLKQVQGMKYKQYTDEGLSHEEAINKATVAAFVEGTLEFGGNILQLKGVKTIASAVSKSMKMGPRVRKIIGGYVSMIVGEGGEEISQEELGIVTDIWAKNPTASAKDILDASFDKWKTWEQHKQAGIAGVWGAGSAALLGTGGLIAGAPGTIKDYKKNKALQGDLSKEEINLLEGNPLLTKEDVRQERAVGLPKDVIKVDTEKKAGVFGGLEEDVEEIKVTDSPTALSSGIGTNGTIILEEKLRSEAERVEAEKTAREQTKKQLELEKQQVAEAAQRKAEEEAQKAVEVKRQAELDAQEEFELGIAARPGLVNQSIQAVAALESSGDPIVRKAVAPIRKAQAALATREDSAKRLMIIQNDLRVEMQRVRDPRSQALMIRLDEELEIEVARIDAMVAAKEAEVAAKKAEKLPVKEPAKAVTAKAVIPEAKPAVRLPPQKYGEYKTRAQQAAAKGRIAKAKKIAKTKAAIEKVKVRQEIKEARIATKKVEVSAKVVKLAKTKAAIEAEKKARGIRYERVLTAGQIHADVQIAGTKFGTILDRISQAKPVRKTLTTIAKTQGKSFYVDVMHPAKMGSRLYQQQRDAGLDHTAAKASVAQAVSTYTPIYNQVAARYLKITSPAAAKAAKPDVSVSEQLPTADTAAIRRDVLDSVARAKLHLKGITGIEVLGKSTELRASNPDMFNKMKADKTHGMANALFDPTTKKIYVFTENADSAYKAKQAIWHEFGHFSLGELLGADLDSVVRLTATKYTSRVRAKMSEGYADETLAAEEVLIDMFTKNETNTAVSKFKNLWDRFIQKIGFAKGEVTEADVRDLVAKMRKKLIEGKVKPSELKRIKAIASNGWNAQMQDLGTPQAKYLIDKVKWTVDQDRTEFGIVNNRMQKELEVFEKLFGTVSTASMMPGKYDTKTRKRPVTRTITARDLGEELERVRKDGTLKRYLDPKVSAETIATERGLKGKAKLHFMTEIKDLRSGPLYIDNSVKIGKKVISSNDKAGMSLDFWLGTCQPTQPCKECYAATAYFRMSAVKKSFRNTAYILAEPKLWAKKVAAEVKAIPQTKIPFIRLLGSGDMTFSEQVAGFNELAKVADRPIHIFSRHHDNLRKLKGTKNAPFMKMGSIDTQLFDHYGIEYLEENTKLGIANAFLYTDKAELPKINELIKKDSLGLVLSADTDLHKTLTSEAQASSCPCDAGERAAFGSCRMCAMSEAGCFMTFAAKGFDMKGKVWELTDPKAPADLAPFTMFLRDAQATKVMGKKAQAYSNVAMDMFSKAMTYTQTEILKFTVPKKNPKTGKIETSPYMKLKDIRFPDQVTRTKDVEAAKAWKENLGHMRAEAKKGTFLLPSGDIQPTVEFKKGKAIRYSKAELKTAGFESIAYREPKTKKIHKGKPGQIHAEILDDVYGDEIGDWPKYDNIKDMGYVDKAGKFYDRNEAKAIIGYTESITMRDLGKLKYDRMTFKSRREFAAEKTAALAKFAKPIRKPKKFRPGQIPFTKQARIKRVLKQKAQVKDLIIGGIKKGVYTGAVRFVPMADINAVIKAGKITQPLHCTPILGKDYDAIPAYGDNTKTPAAMIVDKQYTEPKPDAHTNEAYIKAGTPIEEITFIFPTDGKIAEAIRVPSSKLRYDITKPTFKKWFKKSVVSEKGKPITLYHGTTHEFTEFDPAKGFLENFLGRALYFTDNPSDASKNYGTLAGADISNRIGTARDWIEESIGDMDRMDIKARWPSLTEEQLDSLEGETKEFDEVIQALAEQAIAGENLGSIMPVYVRIERPLYLNGPKETEFDLEVDWDYYEKQAEAEMDKADYADKEEDWEIDKQDRARELYSEDPEPMESGNIIDLKNAFFEIADDWGGIDAQDVWNGMREMTDYYETVAASDLFNAITEHVDIQELTDPETGELTSAEFQREWIERAGYDGVIVDASKQFPGMLIDQPVTTHYMPFKGTQVKSIFNMGKWSPAVADIRYSKKQLEDNGLEYVAFRHPKTKRVYHGRPGLTHADVLTENFGDLENWPEFDNTLDMGYILTKDKKFVNRTQVAEMMGFQRPESAESLNLEQWGVLKYSRVQLNRVGFKGVAFKHPKTKKITRAEAGQTHESILVKLYGDNVDNWPDFDDSIDMGYIGKNGKFVTRRAAAPALGEIYADSDIMRDKGQLPIPKYSKVTLDQQKALDHIGLSEKGVPKDTNLLEISWFEKNVLTKMADSLYALDKMERGKTMGDLSGHKSFNMLSNFPAMFSTFLNYGRVKFQNNWMVVTPENDGGLFTVEQRLGKTADSFFKRLTAKSGKEILDRDAATIASGKPSRFAEGVNLFGKDKTTGELLNDRQMVKDLLAGTVIEYRENKELWDWAEKRLQELNTSVLDMAESSNLIDPTARKKFEREYYIPFFRIMDDMETGEVETMFPKTGDPTHIAKLHKLAGGHGNVGDPFNNLVNNYSFVLHESLRNLARGKSASLAKEMGLIEKTTKAGKRTIGIRVKGQEVMYNVLDPELYKCLVDIDTITNGWMSEGLGKWLLRKPKLWLTKFVTYDPAFRIANFTRDTLHTSFMQKGFIPIFSSLKGGYHALFQTNEFKEFASTGGAFTGAYHERDTMAKTAEEVKRLKKRIKRAEHKAYNPIRWLDVYRQIGEASENAARMGVYMIQKRKGVTPFEAAYSAKDLLDFHRSGSSGFLSFLTQTVPFLNARIQGMYKLGRTAVDQKTRKNFWVLATAMSAATTAYFFMGPGDDDRYKELTDADKMMYWHFYDVPGVGHLKIPKPFEVGAFFGSIPEAFMEYVEGQRNGKELASYIMRIFRDMLRMDMPQSAKVLAQQWANKDYFTGAPIVPARQAGARAEVQYGEKTAKLARVIGAQIEKVTGDSPWASPRRIQKVFEDLFSYGTYTTSYLTDMIFQQTEMYPADPALADGEGFSRLILGTGRFAKGEAVPKYTKSQQTFYEMLKEANAAADTFRIYKRMKDKTAAKKFRKAYRKEIRIAKRLSKWQRRISKYNQKIDIILASRRYNAQEKREKIDALILKRLEVFKKAVAWGEKKLND